jgi:oxygen-independent coproporphyrinogen-3 oxidase
LIAGGTRYHAHFVPDDDLTAEFYETACSRLNAAGIEQYEISNFARPGFESQHNLRYWTRQPYWGFGVDAHSMLPAAPCWNEEGAEALRFATTDSFDRFFHSSDLQAAPVSSQQALEERFFLGLRLNRGVALNGLRREFGPALDRYDPVITELVNSGLLTRAEDQVKLTPPGRLLSNEVFEKFILDRGHEQ